MAKRRLIGGVILGLALALPVIAEPPTTAVIGTPPQPVWNQLVVAQKTILAPLASDWDKMDNIHRKKWLGIAERYPSMKPDEQHRVQDRMREWASLTPEQRTRVRDSYKDFNQLPPEQKQVVKQKWEAYSNLPADQKQRVRESGKSIKLLTPTESTSPVGEAASAATSVAEPATSETAKP
jgi:hypothetical protein